MRFKIDDTSVEMTPDRKGLYLTIAVTEGDQYTVGKTSLRGDTLKYGEQMKELLNFEEGEVYSAAKVASVEKALSDYLGKYGYAYSRVRAFPTFDDENKVAEIKRLNKQDGQEVQISDKTTPTLGEKPGFFERFFGGVGNYSPFMQNQQNPNR